MSLMEPTIKKDSLYIDPIFDKKQFRIWTADNILIPTEPWVVLFNEGGCNNYGTATGDLIVTSAALATGTLGLVDAAIQSLADVVAGIGDNQKRLTYKEQNLSVSMNNYEAARSRIADADFAREQMEIVKLQILQQTGTASLAQANAAPQAVLSLIDG